MVFSTISNAKKQTKLSYLGSINSSAKILKNGKVSKQHTYIIYLMPSNFAGYNTCLKATPECRLGCLVTSGRVKMDSKNIIINSRTAKTKLFFEHQNFFMQWLIADIKHKETNAIKEGFGFSVRLNGTSDIDWARVLVDGKNIFQMFPHIQFYDYTKIYDKFNHIDENYHLTFSYTGRNWDECKDVLNNGSNVAVVFNLGKNDPLPTTFNGYPVVNGDLTDYRPNDGNGVIVGLTWKNIKDKEANEKIKHSVFVVQSNNKDCAYTINLNIKKPKIIMV